MNHTIFFVSSLLVAFQVICSGTNHNITKDYENQIKRRRFQDLPPFKAPVIGPCVKHPENCNLSPILKAEIVSYRPAVETIVREVLDGESKGRAYKELGKFVDLFGARVSGSKALEDSIDYMLDQMKQNGLQNVHGEEVVVPHYVRGEERAELLTPRRKHLTLLGLDPSVGTPAQGIEADVLVVTSFEDLKAKAKQAKGKIIVFNQDWQGSYKTTAIYRIRGAIEAATVGGIATLIRSITDFSLNTPHTGGMTYEALIPEIPAACITVEDAELLYRLQESGEKLRISFKMSIYKLPATTSRNVFGEITGNEKPNELVGLSGHIDSWDVGQGALDDAGGTQISVEALYLLKRLGLTTHRTLQAILWTSEEAAAVGVGVADYVKRHDKELANFSAVFESDSGTFNATGLDFAGSEEAG
ncbi:unnamed protein product [Allacma fusca]|uniref:Carboxypeptidase Q n=1 Tax=Allacma fusca TaxID=39272 RepID=A0A8J2NUW7_9HEXA|nr:unnamed protein product [Allacma fusca]